MFHTLFELPVVVLRVFMVYGPGQQDTRKLVPYTILSALRGESPKLSSGVREVDWVYVDDVVDAYLAAASATEAEGSVADVGSGDLLSIRRIVEKIVELVDPSIVPGFGAVEDRPQEQTRRANVARSAELLGWSPGTPLEAGLRSTIAWYREESEAGRL
jgi:nucleoside-diphosphate-sugar epimerase